MKKKTIKPVFFGAFDGISCGQIAARRAGIYYSKYYSSELLMITTRNGIVKPNPVIDIVKYHFPDTIFVGDITKINGYDYEDVDILLGGSPCQSFSNAGQREGFDGTSRLFWEYVRLRSEMNPTYYLLENVVMKDKWIHIISDALGCEPYFINSLVVSAQSRPRLYWSNIPYTEIQDKKIVLGDVILGAITGTGKHGKLNPLYNIVPGEKKWKNHGWEDNPYNKAYCLVRSVGHYKNTQGKVKLFTAEDCEVLQNIPVGYTGVTGLCKSKRIEALGNAWTVDVLVEAFFKNLPWATKTKFQMKETLIS
jgi:DNA (cytosine-5)-methyltransferase 3A